MTKQRIWASYTTFTMKEAFWQLDATARRTRLEELLASLAQGGQAVAFYQVFPARAEYDFLVWTTVDCESLDAPNRFLEDAARRLSPFRQYVSVPTILCGVTKPSTYVRQHENPQEIDPYAGQRAPYFVIYPFSKTADWHIKPREERQQLMTEHIRLGKTYPEIKQQLLYSFGIQDQEFIVAYEMADLVQFSDLVQALRATAARIYTLLDTPIITGTLRTPAQLVDIFAGDGRPS